MATFDNLYTNTSDNDLLNQISASLPVVTVPPMPTPINPQGQTRVYADTSENQLLWKILHQLAGISGGGGSGTTGWALNGNGAAIGNFVGTNNATPLVLKQNGGDALKFMPNGVSGNILESIFGDEFVYLRLGANALVPSSSTAILSDSEIEIKSGQGVVINSTTGGSISAQTEQVISAPKVRIEVDVASGNGLFADGLKAATAGAKLLAIEVAPSAGEIVSTGLTISEIGESITEAIGGQFWKIGGNVGPTDGSGMVFGATNTNDVAFVVGAGEVMRMSKTKKIGILTNSPNSDCEVAGSFGAKLAKPVLVPNGTFTVPNSTDGALTYVLDYSDDQDCNFDLPDPANCAGRLYIIKRTFANGGGGVLLRHKGTGDLLEDTAGNMVENFGLGPGTVHWLHSDGSIYHLLFNR